MVALLFLLLLLPGTVSGEQQSADTETNLLRRLVELSVSERWPEVLRLLPRASSGSADLDYYRGIALARLQRPLEARDALEIGRRKAPSDKKFLLELAGVDFQLHDLSGCRRRLRQALKLTPDDPYGNNFLATVYSLEGNLEAALSRWNRVGRPQIEEIQIPRDLRIDGSRLDGTMSIAPASVLNLGDLLATRARLDSLDAFSRYRFRLAPREDGKFDLRMAALERHGWKDSKLEAATSLLRELPYRTVHVDLFNIRGTATNFESMVRLVPDRSRVVAAFSAPVGGDAARRFRLAFDGRKENWTVPFALDGNPSALGMEKFSIAAGIESVVNGRWSWQSDVQAAIRRFPRSPDIIAAAPIIAQGFSLKHKLGFDHKLLFLPERRLTVQSTADWELGKVFAHGLGPFSKLSSGVETLWFPQTRGDDYRIFGRLAVTKTLGDLPFDEISNLGLDRDNRLYLRGHSGLQQGRKGAGPLGGAFILLNSEIDKHIFERSLWGLQVGPFLDTARVYETSGHLGSKTWLWDAGLQAKLHVIGRFVISMSYGVDLRSGRGVFYTSVSK